MRGASQAVHSNGSDGGQPEAWVPHPHFRCPRAGGNGDRAGDMLPSLTHAPGESEGKDVGEKGGSPSSLPFRPLQGVGEGSHRLCFRGRLREGGSLAQSHAAQQGPEP